MITMDRDCVKHPVDYVENGDAAHLSRQHNVAGCEIDPAIIEQNRVSEFQGRDADQACYKLGIMPAGYPLTSDSRHCANWRL